MMMMTLITMIVISIILALVSLITGKQTSVSGHASEFAGSPRMRRIRPLNP